MNLITTEVLEKLDEIEVILRPHKYPYDDVCILLQKLDHIKAYIAFRELYEDE